MFTNKALRPFLVAILVIAAFIFGAFFGNRSDELGDVAQDIVGGDEAELSSEALDVIDESYFEEVDTEQLENASVRGMVTELKRRYKDRFSHYFGPAAFERFQELTEGSFSGVGMSVTGVKRGLRVARRSTARPRRRRGSAQGDIVTEVEGKSIAGEDPDLATAEIKGKAGTEVTITVLRPSTGDERELTVTRRGARGAGGGGQAARLRRTQVAHVGCSASRAAPTPSFRGSSAWTRRARRPLCSTCAATAAACWRRRC